MRLPENAVRVMERLQANGFTAWAVGGCVRDFLLGRAARDFDVATDALPQDVTRLFADGRVVPTGVRFGTVTVISGDLPVEVTTLRRDGAYADNRRPGSVEYTADVGEDLARRDFTVNAIAWSTEEGYADPFNGRADLQAGLIRCVGDPEERFGEDALRMLRAIRLAAELRFSIEERTAAGLHKNRDLLLHISPERIGAEFGRLLLSGRAAPYLAEFRDVFGVFVPGWERQCGLEQTSALADAARELPVKLAVLLDGMYGGEEARAWMRGMKYDNRTTDAVLQLLRYMRCPVKPTALSVKLWLKVLGPKPFLRLLHAKSLFEDAEPQRRLAREILSADQCFSLQSLAVDGNDLLRAGLTEGREIGRMLENLLLLVIRGRLPNAKEALLERVRQETGV